MSELAKSFEPAALEAHWGPTWEAAGLYAPTLDPARPSFSIQLPPPRADRSDSGLLTIPFGSDAGVH